jgi:hypothetical protein
MVTGFLVMSVRFRELVTERTSQLVNIDVNDRVNGLLNLSTI